MFSLNGTLPAEFVPIESGTVRIMAEDVSNACSSPIQTVRGAEFHLRSSVADVIVQGGEPMIPARWEDIEDLMTSHFERYDSVMSRLA